VVFAGNSGDAPQAEMIASQCQQAKVAFLYHQIDSAFAVQGWSATASDLVTEGPAELPDHPFEKDVQMRRPTLSDLRDSLPIINNPAQSSPIAVPTMSTANPPQPTPMKLPELPVAPSESPSEWPSIAATAAPAAEPTQVSIELSANTADDPAETLAEASIAEPADRLDNSDAESPTAECLDLEVVDQDPQPVQSRVSETDANDFDRLDLVVRKGFDTFIEVGRALTEINQRNLWRAGHYPSWAAYCVAHGLTRIHANRLIRGSALATRLAEVKPAGFTGPLVCPRSEWQIRPLYRLQDEEKQNAAWLRAVERAGGQPTEQEISAEVTEIIGTKPPATPDNRPLLIAAFKRFRKAVIDCDQRECVAELMSELERLLKL
jgi:hypothetical protein